MQQRPPGVATPAGVLIGSRFALASHRVSRPHSTGRLALEADRAETKRSASRGSSFLLRSRSFLLLGSSFLLRSRRRSGSLTFGRLSHRSATAITRRRGVAAMATVVTMATMAAVEQVAKATVVAIAAATVASFQAAVSGDHSDANDSQEQGNAESQSAIHPRYLH